MLWVYLTIILTLITIPAFIRNRETVGSWIKVIVCYACLTFLLTGIMSLMLSKPRNLITANEVEVYNLAATNNYYVIEDQYNDYSVTYIDKYGQYKNLTCYNSNTVFTNDKTAFPSVAIIKNKFKHGFWRHLLWDVMIEDKYVITCGFDTIKPFYKTT